MLAGNFELLAFLADLTEQPGILNGESGLRGEGLQQVHDFGRKVP